MSLQCPKCASERILPPTEQDIEWFCRACWVSFTEPQEKILDDEPPDDGVDVLYSAKVDDAGAARG